MQFNQCLLRLILIITIVFYNPFLFCAQAANNKYISATVSISADGFISLEQAFKEVQPQLTNVDLLTNPICQKNYHMTLTGLNIILDPNLSSIQQQDVVKTVKNELSKAAHDALEKTLDHLKKKQKSTHAPIILKFAYIGIFQKKIVAIFETSEVIQILVNNIESYFKNNIKNLVQKKAVTAINKHQAILQPHVSLANITNNNQFFGVGLVTKTVVKDFHIGKPTSIISIQLR